MTDLPSTDQALGWLTEQLGALSRLRNSSPRSHEFKQWRQSTLTAAQRIWPNDPERSERFRRIPFSSGPRSTERSAREAFDHGCSEARRIIRLWVAELKHHGVERSEVEAPRVDPALEEERNKGRLKEMLGFEIPLAPTTPEVLNVDEHAVPDARDAAAHKKRSRRGAQSPAPPQAPLSAPLLAAAPIVLPEENEVRLDQPASSEPILVDRRPAELTLEPRSSHAPAPVELEPNLDDLLGLSIAEAIERVKVEEDVPEDAPVSETPVVDRPADLEPSELPSSPSAIEPPASFPPPASTALPPLTLVEPATATESFQPAIEAPWVDPMLAAAAQGLAAFASESELHRHGVPEADHVRVATALTNLSDRLHSGELDWSALRATMVVVMDHPILARRALPLLHPFFDVAA